MKPVSPVRALALAAALTLLAGGATSQSCFSKLRMHYVHWDQGSTLQVGDTDSGSAGIAFTFSYDADVGFVLDKIGHRGTRPDGTVDRFEYTATPPAGEARGLWKAVLRPRSSNDPVDLLPDSASNFYLFVDDPCDTRKAVLGWFGCDLGSCCQSVFWVELQLTVCGPRAEWDSRVLRFQRPGGGNEPYTLDEVHAPIIYARQPGDSGLARILIPAALNFPLPATNLPMRLWRLFGLTANLEHPARGQQMQFSALYAGDPNEIPEQGGVFSAYRKILYFATEDNSGYYKRFQHDCVVDPQGLEYYRWAPIYFPTYGPSPYLAVHISPYPAVMCALDSRSDAYWYDVCEHYRQFVDNEMGLTPIEDPSYALNRDYMHDSVFVPTSIFKPVNPDLDDIFTNFVDAGLDFQQVFKRCDGTPSPLFMEWQKWLKGDPAVEDPMGPSQTPNPFSGANEAFLEPTLGARQQIARANQNGINMSMYTIPLFVNNTNWPSFDDDWFLHKRDGSLYAPLAESGGILVDFGNRHVPPWFPGVLHDDIMDAVPEIGGFFLDTLGGQGHFLRYPPENKNLFSRQYNGGDAFAHGVQRTFDGIRARIGRDKPTNQHPDVPFVLTEAVQEFYAGKYDFAQHGYKPLPLQTQLNSALDQVAGVLVPPPVGTTMANPPLWNTVYHEYSRGDALGVMLSTLAVKGGLGGGQTNPAYPGLSWGQWGNYMRMVFALEYVQGMKPTIFPYYYDYRDLTLFVNRNGTVEARDPSVPQQVQLIQFLQRLNSSLETDAEAGLALGRGIAERPLQLPPKPAGGYDPFVLTTMSNPSTLVQVLTDPARPGSLHFYEDALTTFPYQVPHILHSVWRESPQSDRLVVVFVNWTDIPSAWTGDFDPSLYDGVDTDYTVRGLRPDGAGGVTTYDVGQGNGRATLAWGAAGADIPLQSYDQPAPSFMPARSVQVFVIQ